MAKQLNLKVHTFGIDPRSRYGLAPRRHMGGPNLKKQDAYQLHEATRGAAIAAQLAWDDHSRKDLALSLLKTQAVSAELARRLLDEYTIGIARDDRSVSEIVSGSTEDT